MSKNGQDEWYLHCLISNLCWCGHVLCYIITFSSLLHPQTKALFLICSASWEKALCFLFLLCSLLAEWKLVFGFGMSCDIFKVKQGVLFMICLLVSYTVSCLHCKHSSLLIFPQIPSFVAASWAIHVSWPGISFHEAVLIGRNYKRPLKSILCTTFNYQTA